MLAGNLKKAEKILKNQISSSSLNSQLYFLYGQILGKRVQKNRLLIHYYQQIGEYERVLAKAKISAKIPNIDWRTRSIFYAK